MGRLAAFNVLANKFKETKYVVVGEKAKAQFMRDSRKHIDISITELQKNPLNYTQVSLFLVCLNICACEIQKDFLILTNILKA